MVLVRFFFFHFWRGIPICSYAKKQTFPGISARHVFFFMQEQEQELEQEQEQEQVQEQEQEKSNNKSSSGKTLLTLLI